MYSESRVTNAKNYARRALRTLLGRDHFYRPTIKVSKVRLGSIYGGWWVADAIIRAASDPIVISCGIGCDISFDTEMIRMFNSDVYAFDPTPKSTQWLAGQLDLPAKFRAFPYGLASFDGHQKFGPPSRSDWDDFSVLRSKDPDGIVCNVKRLSTIVTELKLKSIDVLKLDIEGSEYCVVEDLLSSNIRPKQILIEYHHSVGGIPVSSTRQSIESLKASGYHIFDVSPWGRELSLLHEKGIS